MKVATILLSPSNKYIDKDGNLPSRPRHDKALLTGLCDGRRVSAEGYALLPPSIQKICMVNMSPSQAQIMPITIKEIASADLLIVSRSSLEVDGGKEFRLKGFKCLVKDRKVELWISIK